MNWIPLTERCKHMLDSKPCPGWWAVWNRPSACPKCGGATSEPTKQIVSQPSETVFVRVPAGAVAARFAFELNDERKHYRFMPGVKGFIDVYNRSQAIGVGGSVSKHDIAPLAGQSGSGRELRGLFRAAAGTPIECQAFLFLDGPFGLRLQSREVRARDHHQLSAVLSITASIENMEAVASRLLVSPRSAADADSSATLQAKGDQWSEARYEGIEELLSSALAPLIARDLSRHHAEHLNNAISAKEVLSSDTLQRLSQELQALGLRLDGANELLCNIPHLEAQGAAKAKIATATENVDLRAQWSELELRAAAIAAKNEDSKRQLGADATVSAEIVDNRLRELGKLVRERLAADQAHAYRTEHGFLEMIRKSEHQVQLDGLLRDHEIAQLQQKIENGMTFDQAAADIRLRELVRGHEMSEARHALSIQEIQHNSELALDESRRRAAREGKKGDEIALLEVEWAKWKLQNEQLKAMTEIAKGKDQHTLDIERQRAQHAAEIEREKVRTASGAEIERIKALGALSPELVALLQPNTNPEVVKAIFAGRPAAESERRIKELETLHQAAVERMVASKDEESTRSVRLLEQAIQSLSAVAKTQAEHSSTSQRIVNRFGQSPSSGT
jgi:hypothetical protein